MILKASKIHFPHSKQHPPTVSVLANINKVNENILILRNAYTALQTRNKHITLPPHIYYDQEEEIMETLQKMKEIAQSYDPLEKFCTEVPDAPECKSFDL